MRKTNQRLFVLEMIVSRCCKSNVVVFETTEGGYYACDACKLPADTFTVISFSTLNADTANDMPFQGVNKMSMLDKLKKHINKGLLVPLLISAANYAGLIFAALSDGDIDDVELHNLLSTGSGIQIIALIIIMAVLKLRNK